MAAELHVQSVYNEVKRSVEKGRTYSLDGDIFIIGRSPISHIIIAHGQVSRQHTKIVNRPRGYFVVDMDSTNGTYHNGKRLAAHDPQFLGNNDLVSIADLLVLRFEDSAVTEPVMRAASPHLSTRFMLENVTQQVYIHGNKVKPQLSPLQFKLLKLLHDRGDAVTERYEIADALWPEALGSVSNATIDNRVSRLRRYLEDADGNHKYIETVRGRGYRFLIP